MLSKLIEFSLGNRFLVFVLIGLMAMAGFYAAVHLPIDAVPDMTNVQVQIVTDAGALSPVEVEQYVTYPVEWAMGGLPNVQEVRSISRFGISVVTVVFHEGTDIYWARQQVLGRLPQAVSNIPPGYGQPELGPLTTALGEILQFEVRGEDYTAMELRTILDWEIAPRLREVAGVTEINTHGGFYKTFEVRPNPDRLTSYGISLEDLFKRLENNNVTAGGGYVVHHGEQRFIRGQALLKTIADIEQIVVHSDGSQSPILLRDVADVAIAPMTRQGAVTRDGRGEAVTGLVMMLVGANSREVVVNAKARLEKIEETLPEGVTIEVTYDRAALINRTLSTVLKNLTEGGALVILVLLFMLGSFRAGLVVALAIPLSMLFATNLMWATGITASLMSLGAIDFGLIVDSSVIMVENCIRRVSENHAGKPHAQVIRDAAIEVRKPTMFGELIIAVVYVPILALQGTEGKLFRPMALTVLFALAGSLVLSLTFHARLGLAGIAQADGRKRRLADSGHQKNLRSFGDEDDPTSASNRDFVGGNFRGQYSRRPLFGGRVHAAFGRGRFADRSRAFAQRILGRFAGDVHRNRKVDRQFSRSQNRVLQNGPTGNRQRRDGRASNRCMGASETPRSMARTQNPQ